MRCLVATCDLIGPVNVDRMREWIISIPFKDWPQQNKPGAELKPAMVTDLAWHDFGEVAKPVVDKIMAEFEGLRSWQHMLSVVMPGHSIPQHRDEQASYWLCRVHVPLMSNAKSKFIVGWQEHVLQPGFAYRVNTEVEHSVTNDGDCPRIHFMFDVGRP